MHSEPKLPILMSAISFNIPSVSDSCFSWIPARLVIEWNSCHVDGLHLFLPIFLWPDSALKFGCRSDAGDESWISNGVTVLTDIQLIELEQETSFRFSIQVNQDWHLKCRMTFQTSAYRWNSASFKLKWDPIVINYDCNSLSSQDALASS